MCLDDTMNAQMKESIRSKVESYIKRATELTDILRSSSDTRDSVGDDIAESSHRRLMQNFEGL